MSIARARAVSCCRPPLCKTGLGAYPYIVTPLANYDSTIPYFTVALADGTNRRAWLNPPTTDDEVATITLESLDMSRGRAGAPQRAQIQTNIVGVGLAMPQSTPIIYSVYNAEVGNTWHLGCEEDGDGKLIYSAIASPDACLSGPATNTWFVLTMTNPLQPNLLYGTTLTCQTQNKRVLRALPTLSTNVYELAWRFPASSEGLSVSLTEVYPDKCLPCSREVVSSLPLGSALAGPTW